MTLPDPLLPMPDEVLDLPRDMSAEDRLKATFSSIYDHINLHAMAWPAKDSDGNLMPPPAEHVLHELAHVYELVDEERLLASPKLGDVHVDSELPGCDFCGEEARYDAMIEKGGGAYMCGDHYSEYGSGTLGASGDTYLMLNVEVPVWVQDVCNQLRSTQGRGRLF